MGNGFLNEVFLDQVNQYAHWCIFAGLKVGLEFGNAIIAGVKGIAVYALVLLPVKNRKAIT